MRKLIADESKCIACGVCMKTCAMNNFASMDVSKSYIRVYNNDGKIKIDISDNCIGCGMCVRYCKNRAIRLD